MARFITTFLNSRYWDREKKGIEPLRDFLTREGVNNVLDVRFNQALPFQFNHNKLSSLVKSIGLVYTDMRIVGNPKALRVLADILSEGSDSSEAEKAAINGGFLAEFLPLDQFRNQPSNFVARVLYLHYLAYFNAEGINAFKKACEGHEVNCLICNCPTDDSSMCHRFWLLEFLESRKNDNHQESKNE